MANKNDPINRFTAGDLASNKKPTSAGAGELASTTRAAEFGKVEGIDPARAFGAGVQAGSQSLLSTGNYFKALGSSLLGNEKAMNDALLAAERAQGDSAAYTSEFEQFEQFLSEPTFAGFLNQVFLATGQFTPSAIASIAGAFSGAGVGALVAGSALKAGGSKALTNLAAKKLANKEFKNITKKRLKKEGLDADEEALESAVYNQLRSNYMKKASVRGALGGAFATEYPQLAGTSFGIFAEQGMTDPVSAFAAAGIGAPAAAIGVGGEALVAKYFLNKLKKGDGPLHKSVIAAIGGGAARTGTIEGLTELAQEEISIQQRFAIDDDYAQAQANLDRAHSAFAGFFGGAGMGSLGGTITGTIDKARRYVDEKYEQEQVNQYNRERYGDVEPGDVYKEPTAWLEAQFNAIFDESNSKDSVYLDANSFAELQQLIKKNPELVKRIDEELLKSETTKDNFRSGVLFSKDQKKIDQFNKTRTENPLNTVALDNTLASILDYEHSRKPEDDEVVEVLDENGLPVWYQSTNAKDASKVRAKAKALFPNTPNNRIVRKSVEKHLEERKAKLDEDIEVRDITIDDFAADDPVVTRYLGLVEKARQLGGIENLSAQEQQTLKQDFIALQPNREDTATEQAPQGQLQEELGSVQQELEQATADPESGIEAFESTIVQEGPGSLETPIRPKKQGQELQEAEEAAKRAQEQTEPTTTDPLQETPVTPRLQPDIFKEGWTAGRGRDESLIEKARELTPQEFLAEFDRNIAEGRYSDSLLRNYVKQSEENPSFVFKINEVLDEGGESKDVFNILKYRTPKGSRDMKAETARWVRQAKQIENKRIRRDDSTPTGWRITNPELGQDTPQAIYMPAITRFGITDIRREDEGGAAEFNTIGEALLGFNNAVTELLLNGYELSYNGQPFVLDTNITRASNVYNAPVLSLPSLRNEQNPDGHLNLGQLLSERPDVNPAVSGTQTISGEIEGVNFDPLPQDQDGFVQQFPGQSFAELNSIQEVEQRLAEVERLISLTVAYPNIGSAEANVEAKIQQVRQEYLRKLNRIPKERTQARQRVSLEAKRDIAFVADPDNSTGDLRQQTRELLQQERDSIKEYLRNQESNQDLVGQENNFERPVVNLPRENARGDLVIDTTADNDSAGPAIVEGQRQETVDEEGQVKIEQIPNVGVVRDPESGRVLGRTPPFTMEVEKEGGDIASERAKIEFEMRDKFSFLELPRSSKVKSPSITASSTLSSRLGEDAAIRELLNIIKNDFKFSRNLQIITVDDNYDNEFVRDQQAIIRGEKADSNGETKPLLGRILSSAQTDVIIINVKQDASPQQQSEATLALLHEVGHAIFQQEFINSLENKPLRQSLQAEFEKAKAEIETKSYDGEFGFEEWYADQIGAYLLDASKKAQNQTQSHFKRIANKVRLAFKKFGDVLKRRFTLNPSFENYVEQVIKSYKDGSKDPVRNPLSSEDRILIRNMTEELVPNSFKSIASKPQMRQLKSMAERLLSSEKTLPRFFKFLLYPADNFLRSLSKENKIGEQIAQIFYSRSQSGEATGFLTAKISSINSYLSELFTILDVDGASGITQEALDILLEAEDNNVADANLSPKAREVREWLSEFYERRNLNKLGIRKALNYFPRVMSEALSKSETLQAGLVNLLVTYNEGKTFTRPIPQKNTDGSVRTNADGSIIYERGKDGKLKQESFTITPEYARIMVDGIVKNMGDHKNVDTHDNVEHVSMRELGIGLVKHRAEAFQSIPNKALRNLKDEAGDSVLEDPAISLQKYIVNVVKKTEYTQRGGAKRVSRLLEQIKNPKERKAARNAVDAILGKVNPEMSEAFKAVNSYMLLFNMITLLPFAVFASLPDFAGPVLRSKEFKSIPTMSEVLLPYLDKLTGDSFGGEASAKKREALAQFAKDIGVVSTDAINTMYINAGELDFMVPLAKQGSDVFFKVIGLEWFTKFTRVFAGGMGQAFIVDHAKRAKAGEKRSERYLKELGITAQDVDTWLADNRDLSNNPEVRLALARFVDESIVRPNAAERPLWASDPRFALVWQLKSFFYAYGKNIIGGALRESKNRFNESGLTSASIPLLLGAVTLLPLTMLGLDLRERFKVGLDWLLPMTGRNADSGFFESSGKNYRRSLDMDWGEYSFEILDRSGVFGPLALAFPLFMQNKRYGDPFWVGPLGPTAERGMDLVQGDLKYKDILPVYSIGL